ncbi:hypothetical protein [Rhodomicrobium lacus]|uniref:hypothetical protein n=1 Tax=Rhodomicrobium lacus TaxID=2498452 RepID=UPI000F8D1570|nr:hypothetical protein [Rhodomicrobium lacus]
MIAIAKALPWLLPILGAASTWLGKLNGLSWLGLPIGQIVLVLVTFATNVLYLFLQVLAGWAQDPQGRKLLLCMGLAIGAFFTWQHVDETAHQRGFEAGQIKERQVQAQKKAPVQNRRTQR